MMTSMSTRMFQLENPEDKCIKDRGKTRHEYSMKSFFFTIMCVKLDMKATYSYNYLALAINMDYPKEKCISMNHRMHFLRLYDCLQTNIFS